MTKRILSVAAVLALLFGPMSIQPANAQIMIIDTIQERGDDDFNRKSTEFDLKFEVDEQGLELPMVPDKPGITIDSYAPLGGEIFVLACLGGAYLLGKRRKEE